MLFYYIKDRESFAEVLGLGFGYQTKSPWAFYEVMCDKYLEPCIDISTSAKCIMYAPRSYYISKFYKEGTLDDIKRICKIDRERESQSYNKDCQKKRGPGRPRKIPD